jgi:membrane fusion protein
VENDLFRSEVLEYQTASSNQFGSPTGVLPPSWLKLTLLLTAFILAVIVFLFNANMARKETVRGKLRSDGPEAKIYPVEPGIVGAVLVENGDTVAAGAALFEISSERYLADGEKLSASTLEELSRERKSLLEKRASLQEGATLAGNAAKLAFEDALRKEAEAQDQIDILKRRLKTAEKRRDDISELHDKGIIAEPVLNERVEAVSVLLQNLLQVQALLADARSEQRRLGTESQQIQVNLSRDLSDLDQRLSQIDAQTTRTNAQKGHTIMAPNSGRITALNARVGEYATPNMPLTIILPEDSQLIAEVYVPSRAIGFIAKGQTVKLQYDAFPYQKFGLAYGEVTLITNTSQTPQELGVPSRTGEPLYEVRIALEKQTMSAFGKEVMLQSGMELTADIILEDRKLIEWLMEPLLSVR